MSSQQKRGQAALEFLMTYGWAILVVLVAIGALTYFGVRPASVLPEKCILQAGMTCDSVIFEGSTPRVQMRITNRLGKTISNPQLDMGECGTTSLPASTTLGDGENVTFTISGSMGCDTTSGRQFSGPFKIVYDIEGITGKEHPGELSIRIQ